MTSVVQRFLRQLRRLEMFNSIKVERKGPVIEIVLDRPPANAITPAVGKELHQVFTELRDDPALRVAILTGAGDRIFSGGWDLKDVAKQTDPGLTNNSIMNEPGGFAGIDRALGPDEAAHRGDQWVRCWRRLRDDAGC